MVSSALVESCSISWFHLNVSYLDELLLIIMSTKTSKCWCLTTVKYLLSWFMISCVLREEFLFLQWSLFTYLNGAISVRDSVKDKTRNQKPTTNTTNNHCISECKYAQLLVIDVENVVAKVTYDNPWLRNDEKYCSFRHTDFRFGNFWNFKFWKSNKTQDFITFRYQILFREKSYFHVSLYC